MRRKKEEAITKFIQEFKSLSGKAMIFLTMVKDQIVKKILKFCGPKYSIIAKLYKTHFK